MGIHTLDIEDKDGVVRQYSFHLGTDRRVAREEGWIRAKQKLQGGARSVALRDSDERRAIQIWDFRDLDDAGD